MNNLTDQHLLREYAERRSEAAFTELVRRHVDLVYSAAFRMTGEAHSAQDVTQAVFLALAQNAARLCQHPVLSGWLHTTARNLAAKHVRAAVRRHAREQEAAMNQLLANESDDTWAAIAPHLDAALGELDEADRDAVLLRYFARKSAAEMAGILEISDEAAQKRVSRAVERLREYFSKRGVTAGAGALAAVIAANSVQASPAGLAVAISAAVLAGPATSTSVLITTTKTIAMTTMQKIAVTAALTVTIGAGVYEAKQAGAARATVQTLQQQQAPLVEQVRQLREQQQKDSNTISSLNEELARTEKNSADILALRGQVGVLKSQLNKATQAAARTQPAAVAPVNAATTDEQTRAMLDFLGGPVLPPANLDSAYTRQGLINAVQSAAQAANITLAKVEIDDSEFPFLVGVAFQNKGDQEKLAGELRKLSGYDYSGSVSGDGVAAMDVIPYKSYPTDDMKTILNRRGLRESMFYEKLKAEQGP